MVREIIAGIAYRFMISCDYLNNGLTEPWNLL